MAIGDCEAMWEAACGRELEIAAVVVWQQKNEAVAEQEEAEDICDKICPESSA
jgi:hypothetical protein